MTYGPEGIGFLSGGSGINEMANLNREQVFWLIQKMEELDKQADVIIVDTGAGIGDSVLEFVAAKKCFWWLRRSRRPLRMPMRY